MRLTDKDKIKELETLQKHNVLMTDIDYKELKLGQLENIEDELGIELIVLFNALKNGCWIRKGSHGTCYLEGKAIFIPNVYLHLNLYDYYTERQNEDSYDESESQKDLCLFDMCYEDINNIARVRDYGKTWALTKEELENDN